MCGAKLLPAPAAVSSAQASVPALRSSSPPSAPASFPAKPQAVMPSRPVAAVSEDSPVISGPSFLGLSTPAPRKPASLSSNPHSSSSNLDYLLEDEEEPRRGGAGKFILILLALALAVGFGYLRWKNQALPWLHSGASKPPAADQAPDATDATSAAPPPTSAAPPSTANTSAPAAASSTTQTPQQTSEDSASNAAPANSPSATNLAAGNPPATADSGAPAASTSSPKADASSASDTSTSSPDSSTRTESANSEPADKEPAAAAPDTPPPPTPKLKKPSAEVLPKPHAGVTPAKSADPVSEAQKYIYGRGVSQDCERGMRLLKPAAAQANPKAMIEMGALYSAGLCTPHDLPTAYRWFAMALRKDPDNQPVQADLQKLWSEMTQPERQLAIKLSQ
jgi:TPR repeat protein